MKNTNDLILEGIRKYDKVFRDLLGEDWIKLRETFLAKLNDLALKQADFERQKLIDEFIANLLETPASKLMRHILSRTIKKEGGYRFFDFTGDAEMIVSSGKTIIEPARPNLIEPPSEDPAPPENEKTISSWIPELSSPGAASLQKGQSYKLYFRVGDPVDYNLVPKDKAKIDIMEIPDQGLSTEWILCSSTVDIEPGGFELTIPKYGDSSTIGLSITPREEGEAQLDVLIYTMAERYSALTGSYQKVKELYRQLQLLLPVGQDSTGKDFAKPPAALIRNDWVKSFASQVNLQPSHEWMTPPGELNIIVFSGGKAYVSGDTSISSVSKQMDWQAAPANIAGLMKNVLASAEKLRAKWDDYLNDLDAADLIHRLSNFQPGGQWNNSVFGADPLHIQNWEKVASSAELRALAIDGYSLYETFFPTGSEIRSVMEELGPGHRINISWQPGSGADYVPHVPWNLFFTKIPLSDGTPLDGSLFMGLRYRIDYTAHSAQAGSKALGRTTNAYSANLLYWGNMTNDPTFPEANWQQQQLSAWANQLIIPGALTKNAKKEMVDMLEQPNQSPLAVIYFFCQCSVGSGSDPVLRFGSTSDQADVLNRTELGQQQLKDRPFVFANACTTSTADAYMANELESSFFRRGCRAYLGTEIKVPIRFASRFAFVFFNFFYRKVDSLPMAGGEAVAQTRLWLWTQYRNIGGLFYSYINQYELFMAEADELKELQNKKP